MVTTVITSILKFIEDEINWSAGPSAPVEKFARLGNIARMEGGGASNADLQDKVILTVVNIDEETTLKNNPHYIREDSAIRKRNPTIFLNLYILISCAADDYETALSKISHVISFFQGQNVFTSEKPDVASFPSQYVEKILMEMVSLNFEQINHLWGVLGGKYCPSVLYKLRLVPIVSEKTWPVDIVKEVDTTSKLVN
jgi:hypothetical protein